MNSIVLEKVVGNLENTISDLCKERLVLSFDVYTTLDRGGYPLSHEPTQDDFLNRLLGDLAKIRIQHAETKEKVRRIKGIYREIESLLAAITIIKSGKDNDFVNFAINHICMPRNEMWL